MKKNDVRHLSLAGMFIALGIVLPIAFHAFGPEVGKVFLPMHIPVLIAGFFLPPIYALGVGIITPLLSSLLTGMPVLFPMSVIMMFELAVYGLTIAVIKKKIKNHWLSLLLALLLGRMTAGLVVFGLTKLFAVQLPPPALYLQGAVVAGLPGIALQLVFIPLLILAVERRQAFAVGAKQ